VTQHIIALSMNTSSVMRQHRNSRLKMREYIVWRVADGAVDWFVFRDGSYIPLDPGSDDVIRSEVFPGLWLDPVSLVSVLMSPSCAE
jgi:hypothetical protein